VLGDQSEDPGLILSEKAGCRRPSVTLVPDRPTVPI